MCRVGRKTLLTHSLTHSCHQIKSYSEITNIQFLIKQLIFPEFLYFVFGPQTPTLLIVGAGVLQADVRPVAKPAVSKQCRVCY